MISHAMPGPPALELHCLEGNSSNVDMMVVVLQLLGAEMHCQSAGLLRRHAARRTTGGTAGCLATAAVRHSSWLIIHNPPVCQWGRDGEVATRVRGVHIHSAREPNAIAAQFDLVQTKLGIIKLQAGF